MVREFFSDGLNEAVSVGGFNDEADGGHRGEALVEGGGANAAGCPQFGERLWLLAVREGCVTGAVAGDGNRAGMLWSTPIQKGMSSRAAFGSECHRSGQFGTGSQAAG